MANLYKPRYTKVDPDSGERIGKSVRKWYGKYRDPEGILQKVPLCEDKQAAQAMLTDIIRNVEREKAGIVDSATNHLTATIESHIDSFRTHLEAKSRSDQHILETVRLIKSISEKCRLQLLSQLQTADDQIEHYLVERRRTGVSHRTVNADLAAIRSFCRWLLQRQRMHRDPTAALQKLNVSEDRRLERRSLTDRESERIVSTSLQSKNEYRGLAGLERSMLYLLALRTGLRCGELRSLTPASFDFSLDPPVVTLQAAKSKRRKLDRLPIPVEVANAIQEFLKSKKQGDPVWQGTWWRHAAGMLRSDLAESEIPVEDEEGRVMDFHGLRTTFITNLSRAGITPAIAQKLARHSDINLTMGTYTQLEIKELGYALDRLPSLTNGHAHKGSSEANPTENEQLSELTKVWSQLSEEVRLAIMKLVV